MEQQVESFLLDYKQQQAAINKEIANLDDLLEDILCQSAISELQEQLQQSKFSLEKAEKNAKKVSLESEALADEAAKVFRNLDEAETRLTAANRTISHFRQLSELIDFFKCCNLKMADVNLDETSQKWLIFSTASEELATAYEIFSGDKFQSRLESARNSLSSEILRKLDDASNSFYFYLDLASRINEKRPLLQLFQKLDGKFDEFSSRIKLKASLMQQITLMFDFGTEMLLEELNQLRAFPKTGWVVEVAVYLGSLCQTRIIPLFEAFNTKHSLESKMKQLGDPSIRRNLGIEGWAADLVAVDSCLTEIAVILQKSNLFKEFLFKKISLISPSAIDCSPRDFEAAKLVLVEAYVQLEQLYVKKSITRILKNISGANSESITSDSLEDSFFILQKTCKRSNSTLSMDIIDRIVPFVFKLIAQPFYETMAKRFASLNFEDPLKNQREITILLNDAQTCLEYSKKLHDQVISEATKLAETISSSKVAFQSQEAASIVLSIEQKYSELLKKQQEFYFNSIIKPQIKGLLEQKLKDLLEILNEIDDERVNWEFCLDPIKSLQELLHPKIFIEMASQLAEFVSSCIEKAVWNLQLNLSRSLAFDTLVRHLVSSFSQVSLETRIKFIRLQEISKLANSDSISEAVELSKNNSVKFHLNEKDIQHVIANRFKFIND